MSPDEIDLGRHCAGCGAHLEPDARECPICGEKVPLHHTLPGMAIESLIVVGLVILAAGALLWLRQTGRGLLSEQDQLALNQVAAVTPTPVPTFTPPPRPTATRVIHTAAPPATPMPETIVHVVRSGDTLFGIAQQYGVVPDEIIALNALERPDALWIGQELTVPLRREEPEDAAEGATEGQEPPEADVASDGATDEGSGEEAGEEAAGEGQVAEEGSDAADADDAGSAEAAPVPTGRMLVIGEPEVHVVQRGESIGVIAAQYELTLDEILALNEDRLEGPNDTLMIGDEIVVSAGQVVTTTPEPVSSVPTQAPFQEVAGGTAGEMSAMPFESAGESEFPSPVPLAPAGGITVTAESPLLRWSSAGVLPKGLFYVVEVRPAGDEEHEPIAIWVSGATAVRMPSELRPALGTAGEIDWAVSVRRRSGGGLLSRSDRGVLLSPQPLWQRFIWAPSASMGDEAGQGIP
jgi:LysM repeat protein